jgi:serine/threonine protein phosphatase PrpC
LVDISGLSDIGCVRTNNEDRFHIDTQLGICLVADGMGGHGYGEIAAAIAVEVSYQFLLSSRDLFDVTWPFGYDAARSLDENRVANAIQLANRRIWSAVENVPKYAGMGCTLIVVTLVDDRSVIGTVGDSRVYLLRNGQLHQLSVDDNWVADLVRKGQITEDDARSHNMRNVLTQAVGTNHDLDVHTREQLLLDGDILLLATDGVYGEVDEAKMRSILYSYPDPHAAAAQLITAAKQNGAPDNATCIVVAYRRENGL